MWKWYKNAPVDDKLAQIIDHLIGFALVSAVINLVWRYIL